MGQIEEADQEVSQSPIFLIKAKNVQVGRKSFFHSGCDNHAQLNPVYNGSSQHRLLFYRIMSGLCSEISCEE